MAGNLILLTILSLCSKILGFMREISLSYFYGAGKVTDIYLMAVSGAGIFFGWMSTFAIIHTPLYQQIKARKNMFQAERFTNQIIFIEGILGFICMLIIYEFGEKLIILIASGFSNSMIDITVSFFRWTALSTIISAINQVYISEMNCKEQFTPANLTNIALSIVQMCVICISGFLKNYTLLKLAMPMGSFFQLILLLTVLSRKKRNYKVNFPFMGEINKFFVLVFPVFISTLMDDVNAFVDKMFGSGLAVGSISALNYAHLIKQLFFYVFASAMITIIYPKLSDNIANGNQKQFGQSIRVGTEYMIILFSIITALIVVYAFPIVELVYKRGSFGNNAVNLTAQALIMYATALLPLAVREILIRSFQALQNTKINMLIGLLSTIINILLNYILIHPLGHMGLALSTSITAYITVPLLFYFLYKKVNNLCLKQTYFLGIKSIISAACACGVSYIIFYVLMHNIQNSILKALILFTCLTLGVIIYICALSLWKVEIIKYFIIKVIAKVKEKTKPL